MKKIIASLTMVVVFQFAFAQQQQEAKPINPVTDQFQNGNSIGWENPALTKTEMSSVPSSVMTNFKSKYPKQTDVSWYSYKNGYTAVYLENGFEHHVMYDLNGQPMGMGEQVKMEMVPSATSTYLKQNYPGKSFDRVYSITSSSGEKYYEVYVDGNWMRFDSKGNPVPTK